MSSKTHLARQSAPALGSYRQIFVQVWPIQRGSAAAANLIFAPLFWLSFAQKRKPDYRHTNATIGKRNVHHLLIKAYRPSQRIVET